MESNQFERTPMDWAEHAFTNYLQGVFETINPGGVNNRQLIHKVWFKAASVLTPNVVNDNKQRQIEMQKKSAK